MTLAKKRPKQRSDAFDDLPVVDIEPKLREQIRIFEMRYEMSTAEMREVVRKDPMRETAEICDWLMADSILKDFAAIERSTAGSDTTDTSQSIEPPSNGTPS